MIKPLSKDNSQVENLAQLVLQAFSKDPLFLRGFKTDLDRKAFTSFMIKKALVLKETTFVYEDANQRPTAIASVEISSGSALKDGLSLLKPSFLREVFHLKKQLSKDAFVLMNRYMKLTLEARPKARHHYLVFIGVSPESQGMGIGRQMLKTIHQLVDEDPMSLGIGLDTENLANVSYYENYGYTLTTTKQLGDLTIYCLFRERQQISLKNDILNL